VEVLVAFMLYQAQLQEYFGHLLNSFTNLIKSVGAGAKVFEILERTPVGRGDGGVVPAADYLVNYLLDSSFIVYLFIFRTTRIPP